MGTFAIPEKRQPSLPQQRKTETGAEGQGRVQHGCKAISLLLERLYPVSRLPIREHEKSKKLRSRAVIGRPRLLGHRKRRGVVSRRPSNGSLSALLHILQPPYHRNAGRAHPRGGNRPETNVFLLPPLVVAPPPTPNMQLLCNLKRCLRHVVMLAHLDV